MSGVRILHFFVENLWKFIQINQNYHGLKHGSPLTYHKTYMCIWDRNIVWIIIYDNIIWKYSNIVYIIYNLKKIFVSIYVYRVELCISYVQSL